MNGTLSTAVLVQQFQEFYREVVALKHLVASGTWNLAATPRLDEDTARSRAITTVWQRLLSLLEQQELAVTRRGGDYSSLLYKEAQYVMAALADETFLHLDWVGKQVWQQHLLETRLFESQSAGDSLFQKLERLLRSGDPVYADLALVYLMALALGFQGKFRGTDASEQLARYRQQLYTFITHHEPQLLQTARPLFPEAGAHTLTAGTSQRLPTARRWCALIGVTILLLGCLSHVLWRQVRDDLHHTITPILRAKP
ncbi:MAG: DotU family type IV/VI secretion system protein [Candidatus Tectimicrobiota bacterium]